MGDLSFKLSRLSMTMIEGEVIEWFKNEGDFVEQDEPLLEVQTDKVAMEVTSPKTGYIKSITAKAGDIVPVEDELCIISTDGSGADSSPSEPTEAKPDAGPSKPDLENTGPKEVISLEKGPRKKISPLAKKIAQKEGLDYSNLTGTGVNGLVVKADILKVLENKPSPSSNEVYVDGGYETIPMKGIRKVIAEKMMLSQKSTASLTTFAEVSLDKIAEMRKVVPLSYTTFILKAVANALAEYKIINSRIEDENILMMNDINVNVAMSVDEQLFTPVIKNADKKNLIAISDEVKNYSEKAKDKKLTMEDLEGGTFTVTNSGVFGSLFFTPMINYPQSAILGMGKIKKVPIVNEDNEIVIGREMILGLTYDHRLIDGEIAVKFLQKVISYIENPKLLF